MRFDLGARENLIIKAAVIALIEEIGKLFVIVLLARAILRRHFNDPMDGLIYGRLVGLAMAVEESLLYTSLAPATMHTLGMEVVRLFAHSLMGGLIGFAVGLGGSPARTQRSYPRLVVLCLLLSTLLHFGWNVIAYAQRDEMVHKLIPMAVMLTLMVTWRWLCGIAENRSRELFSPASAARTGRAGSDTAAMSAD